MRLHTRLPALLALAVGLTVTLPAQTPEAER